ncbi:MAG: MBL fold metallo-hydrolase [Thermoplasmatota archaeon]
MEPRIIWLGHASFRIESEKGTIFIDPWKAKDQPKADMILVTHSHYDHLSEDDISALKKDTTIIVGPKDVKEQIPETIEMAPGQKKQLQGIDIETYRAYNQEKEFHPKEKDWLGYIIDIDGFRIYHSGDTDVIREMSRLKDVDVALLPVGGTYTMTPQEAAKAVELISPKRSIPMHWGDIIGGRDDALKFKELAKCQVDIMEPEN